MSQELNASPGKLVALKCDVRNEDQIKTMFEMVKVKYGGIDVCINNAGLAHAAPLLSGGATEDWRDMLEVRLCMII